MVDLTWQGEGPPPLWALIGQWRSGPTGEIEEWRDNPEYRPSPQMLDWSEPTDAVDCALQLAATGYGPGKDVSEALARAELTVLVTATGSPLAAASPEGTPVIPVYTSQSYLESVGKLLYDRRPVAELVEQLPPGHALYLNPTGPVSMLVDTEELRAALAGVSGSEAREPAAPVAPRPGTGAAWGRARRQRPGDRQARPYREGQHRGRCRDGKQRNGPRRELNHHAEDPPRPSSPSGGASAVRCGPAAARPRRCRLPRRESPGHAVR